MLHLAVLRSQRTQITIVLVALELLILTGAVTAAYTLQASSVATHQLASERLTRMQNAQDLVQEEMQIQFLASSLLEAASTQSLQETYSGVLQRLEAIDRVTMRLAVNDDISVLDLHQASQLFRNTANISAQLRSAALQRGSGATGSAAMYSCALRRKGFGWSASRPGRCAISTCSRPMASFARAPSRRCMSSMLAPS